VERVGRDDNFFELGGHSLLGMKLVATIEAQFGVDIPVAAVFEYPTIQAMAQAVDSLQSINSQLLDRQIGDLEEDLEFEEGVLRADEAFLATRDLHADARNRSTGAR
jgi:acyl carrier protein